MPEWLYQNLNKNLTFSCECIRSFGMAAVSIYQHAKNSKWKRRVSVDFNSNIVWCISNARTDVITEQLIPFSIFSVRSSLSLRSFYFYIGSDFMFPCQMHLCHYQTYRIFCEPVKWQYFANWFHFVRLKLNFEWRSFRSHRLMKICIHLIEKTLNV